MYAVRRQRKLDKSACREQSTRRVAIHTDRDRSTVQQNSRISKVRDNAI